MKIIRQSQPLGLVANGMRKRFVLAVALSIVIAVLLSAAAYVQFSDHIVLHGANASGRMLASTSGMSSVGSPSRPAGVPDNASVATITLHGGNTDLAGGGWTCSIYQYAWKDNPTTMAGNAAYNCSGSVDHLEFWQYADYCKPILWGCTWQNGQKTFTGCTYIFPSWGSCPPSGYYNFVYSIPAGQLWRERSYVCGYYPSSCGSVAVQVQF